MKLSQSKTTEEISIINKGVDVKGDLNSSGSIRIDGKITGNVFVTGDLILGSTGIVFGEVKGRNIVLGGKINGKVFASEKVILESGAELKGDLTAKILVVHEGALFEGNSRMNSTKIE
ncbi:MAG TPA: polymer-forming cytoskeletal protein [Ignavibacteriaceae bacterium]|nr:polymer-forming cytoskeletal protein [Ignavibacteriaceae bacterium]